MMSLSTAAFNLDGREYNDEEPHNGFFAELKEAGIVAVFGASDDLMEFRGAIYDEVGCYDGGTAYLDANGLMNNECSDDDCPYYAKAIKKAVTIEGKTDTPDYTFTFETEIPHATFEIVEDGEKYCRGIVFKMSDLSTLAAAKALAA